MNTKFSLGLICVLAAAACALAGYHGGHGHGHNAVSYNSVHEGGHGGHGWGHGGGQVAHGGHGHGWNQDYYAYPKYKYSYGINDHHTGDVKTASETRDGDVTKGHYSLREPDGGWRQVTYVADKGGFRAHVQRTPGHGHGHQGGH